MNEFYIIKGEKYIPSIEFNAQTNTLEMSGQSYHEYVEEFFHPILDWIQKYLASLPPKITFNFKMTYFNTASSRCLLEVFELLDQYQKNHETDIVINWYYKETDYDMLESGRDYAMDTSLKFVLLTC
jgi:hypothetical protein